MGSKKEILAKIPGEKVNPVSTLTKVPFNSYQSPFQLLCPSRALLGEGGKIPFYFYKNFFIILLEVIFNFFYEKEKRFICLTAKRQNGFYFLRKLKGGFFGSTVAFRLIKKSGLNSEKLPEKAAF